MSDQHADPAAGPAALDPAASSEPIDHDAHAADASEHGRGDALGPIDWFAWGAGLLGVLIGLGTAFAFALATNRLGA